MSHSINMQDIAYRASVARDDALARRNVARAEYNESRTTVSLVEELFAEAAADAFEAAHDGYVAASPQAGEEPDAVAIANAVYANLLRVRDAHDGAYRAHQAASADYRAARDARHCAYTDVADDYDDRASAAAQAGEHAAAAAHAYARDAWRAAAAQR